MPLSIKGLYVTLNVNDIEHNLPSESLFSGYAECHFAECHYVECRGAL